MSIFMLGKGRFLFEPAYYLEHLFNYYSRSKQNRHVMPVLSTLDTQALKYNVSCRIKITLLIKILFSVQEISENV